MTGKAENTGIIETDLLIIGAGLAGMSAAVFAARKNIPAVVAGAAGGFEYASGLMDLWGVSLKNPGTMSKKPWDMLKILRKQNKNHPLARLSREKIQKAFDTVTSALAKKDLAYTGYNALNHTVLTPFGTRHQTYRLPGPMKENAQAFKTAPPCLVLDFRGLREFSARFFCEMVRSGWPDIQPGLIDFPGTRLRSEVFTPFLARQLETPQVQDAFIKRVKPLLKGKTCLGVPAVLGVHSCDAIWQRLSLELNVTLFEIPTSPVSVPGMRLKEALFSALENTSVQMLSNRRVTRVLQRSDKGFECEIQALPQDLKILSKGVILASGRFLSRGLLADRKKIVEPLFNLPVFQPGSRDQWHEYDYFTEQGHGINKAGIKTDKWFRPLDRSGSIIHDNLFAAGSILAHQDWVREKCGSALSLGTAFAAIESYRPDIS